MYKSIHKERLLDFLEISEVKIRHLENQVKENPSNPLYKAQLKREEDRKNRLKEQLKKLEKPD